MVALSAVGKVHSVTNRLNKISIVGAGSVAYEFHSTFLSCCPDVVYGLVDAIVLCAKQLS